MRWMMIVLVVMAIGAGDVPFSVATAKQKHDSAIEKADAEYARAKKNADDQYVVELRTALKETMKAGNLEDSNRIQAMIDAGELEAKSAPALRGEWAFPREIERDVVILKFDGRRVFRRVKDNQSETDIDSAALEAGKGDFICRFPTTHEIYRVTQATNKIVVELFENDDMTKPPAVVLANKNLSK